MESEYLQYRLFFFKPNTILIIVYIMVIYSALQKTLKMFSIFVLLGVTEKPAKKLFFLWEVAERIHKCWNFLLGVFIITYAYIHIHAYPKMQ